MNMTTLTPLPRMVSYYNADLHLSVRVPEDWTGQTINEKLVRCLGPAEPDHNDHRSTLSYQLYALADFGGADYETLIRTSGRDLANDFYAYVLSSEERFVLSSGASVYLRHFNWQDQATGQEFAQLQALILAFERDLYLVNAATLKALSDIYLPIFNAIVKSTRIIRPKAVA